MRAQRAQGRGLARAVGAEQGGDRALLDGEIDAVQDARLRRSRRAGPSTSSSAIRRPLPGRPGSRPDGAAPRRACRRRSSRPKLSATTWSEMLHHQAHVVLDQQHRERRSASRMRRISVPSALDLLVVQAARRLVEQQQLGLGGQGARQLDALLRAERQVGDRASRHAPRSSSSRDQRRRLVAGRAVLARHAAAGAARWRGSRRGCGSGARP